MMLLLETSLRRRFAEPFGAELAVESQQLLAGTGIRGQTVKSARSG